MPDFKLRGAGRVRLKRLDKILTPAGIRNLKKSIAASQAEEAINLIKDGFDRTTDPYGKRWRRKQLSDGRRALHGPTGRLKGGWKTVRIDQHGFVVSSSVTYAAPHQAPRKFGNGRLKRPRRMMVPTESRGFSRRWGRDLAAAARDAMSDFILET